MKKKFAATIQRYSSVIDFLFFFFTVNTFPGNILYECIVWLPD